VATAAALVVLIGVVSAAFYFNNQERLQAEEARAEADKARARAEKVQKEKDDRTRKSVPAFLEAARLAREKRQWDNGLAHVEVALDYDPQRDEAYLLKGQFLMALKRFADAAVPFKEYARRQPENQKAARLAQLAAKPDPNNVAYFNELEELFHEQKAFTVAERMNQLGAPILREKEKLLAHYRKRIEAAPGWAGLGGKLSLDKNGAFHLNFYLLGKQVQDLSPLKDMKLSSLNVGGTMVEDLTPLKGMPLTKLHLHGTKVKNLEPLRGMELTILGLTGLTEVPTLDPLRGMPLTELYIHGCHKVPDLKPLQDMPLKVLIISENAGMRIESLEPLKGMKTLKILRLWRTHLVKKDLEPLRGLLLEELHIGETGIRKIDALAGMPLQLLAFDGVVRDADMKVLEGMPLTSLSLGASDIHDLTPLRKMPLKKLRMHFMPVLRDLSPLADLQLTELLLLGCKNIENVDVLKKLPLTELTLDGCTQLRNLEFVRGMKQLKVLRFMGCKQIDDLTPLKGLELGYIGLTPRSIKKGSMEVLWNMPSLEQVGVEGRGDFRAEKFRDLYEQGEFK
jgi:Leucine-rich repeat (LRR) protein